MIREGRIRRGWRLTRTAWSLLRDDRTMIVLALISVAVSVAAAAAIFGVVLALAIDGHDESSQPWLWAVLTWPWTFVASFFNVALCAAAAAALDGRRLTVRQALAVSVRRVAHILAWSLLASAVGLVLRLIAERLPLGGRIAVWLTGAAWTILTLFAIPVLALEGVSAPAAVRRSTRLVRERWGEALTGSIAINVWMSLPFLGLSLAVLVAWLTLPFVAAVAVSALVFAVVVGVSAVGNATQQVFAVALYRYAVGGDVVGGFAESDLARPLTGRRRWLRRR